MKIFLVALSIACLPLIPSRSEGADSIAPLFSALNEAVFTALLKEYPPLDLFTVAMVYDHGEKVFEGPNPELQKRLLTIPGVKPELYVTREALDIPFDRKAERQPDGLSIIPGVTRKGTDKRVDVYSIDALSWRAGDEIRVYWSKASGPLAGIGGTALFRHDKDGWHFVKYLETYES